MKKILCFCLSMIFGILSYCQNNLEEVVYLKNGSIIRGTIIEQVPNQTLKIQTKDGSVFVYSFSEIEKITKEKIFISPYYNINRHLAEDMQRFKKSGIGLTVTAGVLIIAGSASFAGGRNSSYYNAGGIISGITLLCASSAFIISGPIMLGKYGRAKRELQNQKGISFTPSIKTHNLDGISTNATTSITSFGAAIKFTF